MVTPIEYLMMLIGATACGIFIMVGCFITLRILRITHYVNIVENAFILCIMMAVRKVCSIVHLCTGEEDEDEDIGAIIEEAEQIATRRQMVAETTRQ